MAPCEAREPAGGWAGGGAAAEGRVRGRGPDKMDMAALERLCVTADPNYGARTAARPHAPAHAHPHAHQRGKRTHGAVGSARTAGRTAGGVAPPRSRAHPRARIPTAARTRGW